MSKDLIDKILEEIGLESIKKEFHVDEREEGNGADEFKIESRNKKKVTENQGWDEGSR